MLTPIVLRDTELSTLSRHQTLAMEHLLHERLSEVARARRSGDSALLLAIRASDFLSPLLDELGDEATFALLDELRTSALGRTAFERASAVAALTGRAA
jgi:hypothetical protein